MKLSALNQNNMPLGLNKSNMAPDTQNHSDMKRPLQKAGTADDKETRDTEVVGDPLDNIKREAGLILNPSMPAPFRSISNVNKPPNISNI